MDIIFFGTPTFAATALDSILKNNFNVKCVVTQPDKPQGRKQILTFSPVKICAQKNNLEIFQPNSLKSKNVLNFLHLKKPEAIVVVAYGKILPPSILNLPKFGCINVHGSLLPKYRGAAPIQQSIINGEKTTGITTMFMDEGLDTGDIIFQEETKIADNETSAELYLRLAEIGGTLIVKTLNALLNKNCPRAKQADEQASYAPMLTKQMAKIAWNNPAFSIHNLIRGLNPWPIAFTLFGGKTLKIFKSKVAETNLKLSEAQKVPGEIVSKNPLIVACKNDTFLEISEVQLEGKKKLTAQEFANGYDLKLFNRKIDALYK